MTLRRLSRSILGALATVVLLSAASLASAARSDPGQTCDHAAAKAAEKTGVPIDILLAITRVETGRGGAEPRPWPWTINADGQGNWYETMDAAVMAATTHLTDGTASFDIGCFQLNIRWHGEHFASISDMFDPMKNAEYAATFLAQLYQESGNWSEAVAAYHSRTPDLAEQYLQKVKAVLSGPNAPTAAELVTESRSNRENPFPLLKAGGQGSAGSLVPLQSANGPLIGGTS